jgi:hypothetical protein
VVVWEVFLSMNIDSIRPLTSTNFTVEGHPEAHNYHYCSTLRNIPAIRELLWLIHSEYRRILSQNIQSWIAVSVHTSHQWNNHVSRLIILQIFKKNKKQTKQNRGKNHCKLYRLGCCV